MDIYEKIDLQDCPLCGGASLLEEESGCGFYVTCLDCGCYTVTIDYKSNEGRLDAAEKAAYLWNTGKVISNSPGE